MRSATAPRTARASRRDALKAAVVAPLAIVPAVAAAAPAAPLGRPTATPAPQATQGGGDALADALARWEAGRARLRHVLEARPTVEAPYEVHKQYDPLIGEAWEQIIAAERDIEAAFGHTVAAGVVGDKIVIHMPVNDDDHPAWDMAANVVVIDRARVKGL